MRTVAGHVPRLSAYKAIKTSLLLFRRLLCVDAAGIFTAVCIAQRLSLAMLFCCLNYSPDATCATKINTEAATCAVPRPLSVPFAGAASVANGLRYPVAVANLVPTVGRSGEPGTLLYTLSRGDIRNRLSCTTRALRNASSDNCPAFAAASKPAPNFPARSSQSFLAQASPHVAA